MTNINDREAYNRGNYPTNRDGYTGETHPHQSHLNPDGTYSNSDARISDQVTGTNETNHPVVPNNRAYRDGYVDGRDLEQRREDLAVRDNDNASRGLLLGIILTSLVGLAVGAAYLVTQRNETPVPDNRPIVVPRANPSPNQSPQVRERVIERDRIVPVPQQQAPDVNVTVPSTGQQAPSQTAPSQPSGQTGTSASPSQSGASTGTGSGTSTTTTPNTTGTTGNTGTTGTTGTTGSTGTTTSPSTASPNATGTTGTGSGQ